MVPNVKCYNVFFENLLTGDEPWFVGHQAKPIISNLKAFGNEQAWLGRNAKAHGSHMNIMVESNGKQFVDMIAIDVDGEDPFNVNLMDKGRMMKGSFQIFNDPEFTQAAANFDMSRLTTAGEQFDGTATFLDAYIKYNAGNRLPLYRLLTYNQRAQGLFIETDNGVAAMMTEADGSNGAIIGINEYDENHPLWPYRTEVMTGFNITPWPFYNGEQEVAYNVGKADDMNKLASAQYMSVYLNPAAPEYSGDTCTNYHEFVGAFLKLHEMGA